MTIYRADPLHGVVWLTGGITGLGRALAFELAAAGYTVCVTALPDKHLNRLADSAPTAGPGRIVTYPCDVSDESAMEDALERIEANHGPVVLAVFNAGTYGNTEGGNLSVEHFRQVFGVNVFGVLNGLVPAVRRMQQRTRGHVVIVGSATAYLGLPTAGAYASSKAALNSIADCLRFDFYKMNIRLQIVNPAFIETGLSRQNTLPMPAALQPEEAARRMMKAIQAGGFETTFPRRITIFVKLMALMPRSVSFKLVEWLTAWRGRPLITLRLPKPAASDDDPE